jgi:mycoredoxin
MTENIVMYGADWCGDCRRSKTFLEHRGVPFTYVDLEERPDQMDEVIRRNDGMRSIPVIVFDDGSHLTEPSNDALAAKLGL